MERIGEDLGDPHQAGLHVLDEHQVDGAEQQSAHSHRQPDQPHVVHVIGAAGGGRDPPEQRGAQPQQPGRERPDGQQHDLALQVVADLDVLLVLVSRLIDLIVVLRLEEEVAHLAAHHGAQPGHVGGVGRIGEQHDVGDQEADRAQQMQRLVDAAVVVVTMVVPALYFQGLQEALHSLAS